MITNSTEYKVQTHRYLTYQLTASIYLPSVDSKTHRENNSGLALDIYLGISVEFTMESE